MPIAGDKNAFAAGHPIDPPHVYPSPRRMSIPPRARMASIVDLVRSKCPSLPAPEDATTSQPDVLAHFADVTLSLAFTPLASGAHSRVAPCGLPIAIASALLPTITPFVAILPAKPTLVLKTVLEVAAFATFAALVLPTSH